MQLRFSNISWSSSFKFPGVTFIGGNNLYVDINIVKRKFYSSCNCIFGKTWSLNEIMRLNLQESFCLPVLQYAMAAVRLFKLQVSELNSVLRYTFGFAKSESVRAFIFGTGRIYFAHIRMLQSYNFLEKALLSENCVLQGIASLVKLSKEFKELDMYLAVPGLIENSSCGKINKFVFSRFRQTI